MYFTLNSFKGGYIGDYIGDYYRDVKRDSRSLDSSSYRITENQMGKKNGK